MRIRMYSRLALLGTIVAYPVLYWGWVKQMKDSWLENDILQNHLDIFYPETGRYSKTAATYNVDQQYEEVLIFSSKRPQAETK